IDGDDDGHVGRFGVIERLHGLRHDTVVSGDHQYGDVGDLGAAGTHGGERLVTGGVDEGQRPAGTFMGDGDLVGADVLGDTTGLPLGDLGGADSVQESGLTVVDVAHH